MNEQQRQLLLEALGIGAQGVGRLLNKAAGHGVEVDDPVLARTFIAEIQKLNKNLSLLNKNIKILQESVDSNTDMMDKLGDFIDEITSEE